MQTICWTELSIIVILMKRHRARWLMGYKDFTFVSHLFKFSPVDREQKLNLTPEPLSGIIVGGLQWTSVMLIVIWPSLVLKIENALN